MARTATRQSAPDTGNSLLRTLVNASPLAIYLLDLGGVVQLWNPAAERIFGWTSSEVLGRRDPTVGEDFESVVALISNVVDSENPIEKEVVRYGRTGCPIDIALSATRVVSEMGEILGVMVIAADISDRRRIEHERDILLAGEREARERAETMERRTRFLAEGSALLDRSLDYLATLNNLARLAVPFLADYCLIDEFENDGLSRVAIAHVDPEREKLLHQDLRQPLSGDPEKHPVIKVMLTGESVLVEEVNDDVRAEIAHDSEHFRKLKEIGLHSFIVVPIEIHGEILGTITFAYAESMRRYTAADLETAEELARRAASAVNAARLYRESRRAVQARERLLAIVSHDLRNSLATVLLNSSAILESKLAETLERHVRDQIQWIAKSAEQMNRLISDLLDVSAIELGRFSLDPSRQPVSRLAQEAVQMYRPLAHEKGLEFETHVEAHLPDVLVDPGRVQQVVGNLVTNAVKYSQRDTTIRFSVERFGANEVCFSVADQGSGIEPEHLMSIFDRYWHGRRGGRGGAGLGLGIAKAIVEGHGGRIWVDSRPGEGSTFYFTVPVADVRSAEGATK